MPDFTTHYGWEKPDIGGSADVWGDAWNTNLDGIDTAVNAASTSTSTAYMAGAFVPGILGANQYVMLHIIGMAVTFPINFGVGSSGAASKAASQVNSTATVALVISRCPAASDPTVSGNFVAVGSITFAAAGHAGVFSSSGLAVAFNPGDYLAVVAPGAADPTLAGVVLTLSGNRT